MDQTSLVHFLFLKQKMKCDTTFLVLFIKKESQKFKKSENKKSEGEKQTAIPKVHFGK